MREWNQGPAEDLHFFLYSSASEQVFASLCGTLIPKLTSL